VVYGPDGQPWFELSLRGAALAVLGLFALRIGIHHRRDWLAGVKVEQGDTRKSGRE
jgi:hypothetical protein